MVILNTYTGIDISIVVGSIYNDFNYGYMNLLLIWLII
jgi:hypothetical protein